MSSPRYFRPHTHDQAIWHQVVENDEYRIPAMDATDVVIDVGAHIGGFTWLALERGAGEAHAVEPEPQSFRLLRQNVAGRKVSLYELALWRSDDPSAMLSLSRLGLPNTGGCVTLGEPGIPVDSLAFDTFLQRAAGERPIRLLKLDCEGAEFPILFTSARLPQIKAICGEYHEFEPADYGLSIPRHPHFTMPALAEHLAAAGFAVEHHSTVARLGLFWATRKA